MRNSDCKSVSNIVPVFYAYSSQEILVSFVLFWSLSRISGNKFLCISHSMEFFRVPEKLNTFCGQSFECLINFEFTLKTPKTLCLWIHYKRFETFGYKKNLTIRSQDFSNTSESFGRKSKLNSSNDSFNDFKSDLNFCWLWVFWSIFFIHSKSLIFGSIFTPLWRVSALVRCLSAIAKNRELSSAQRLTWICI